MEEDYFKVLCIDGVKGMNELPDKSIKLIYGSPPYPNAERNYGNWLSDEYIEKMSPFIQVGVQKLKDDGFLVINIKANREKGTAKINTRRSLIVEKLAILLEEKWNLYCVDIEIWIKDNPVPTGLRVACQDAYEQNLWFSKSPKWKLNIDAIRRPYDEESLKAYSKNEYKPRTNGLTYVRKVKRIEPNPLGALPLNIIRGAVSSKQGEHQAMQPGYLPEKYIKAVTTKGDIVVDPWMGSGTTGIEAIKLDRYFIGFDIDENYVSYAQQSLNNLVKEKKMKAKVSKEREFIHDRFIQGLGNAVTFYSPKEERPLLVDITNPLNIGLRVYLFPATNPPGGRTLDEYKFNLSVPGQLRGQKGSFDTSGKRFIILASYLEELDVFVLFDADKHESFSYNANIQCKEEVIYRALQEDVAVAKKKNSEIILAAKTINLPKALQARFNLFGEI